MKPIKRSTYSTHTLMTWQGLNLWDAAALSLIISIIILIGFHTGQIAGKYQLGQTIPIHLDPRYLPSYAVRTTIRLFVALLWSIIFTFIFGTWAAKNRNASRLILPAIDVLQSVPILSFLSFAVSGFIMLFEGNMLGPEFAAIFGVFTSQVWNITLGFYQSLRGVPPELREVGIIFHLSPWQRFWKIEVPSCMPSLIWNSMISMSGSWFFVIACEAFSIAGTNITLPGIGSYIYLAISRADTKAIYSAIVAMLLVILFYDQLIFRPLIYWTESFQEEDDGDSECPWVVELFRRGKMTHLLGTAMGWLANLWINCRLFNRRSPKRASNQFITRWPTSFVLTTKVMGTTAILVTAGYISYLACHYLSSEFTTKDVVPVLALGIFTGTRVMALVLIATIIWVPVGVWIGLRPRLVRLVQPILQFVAAFPANLLFPSLTILIITFKLNIEIWVSPLMILGTQWYILFNVIAGVSQLPKDLRFVADNLQLTGWLWWKRLILPHIAPFLVTGIVTAAGGAWNASIIAEIVTWGDIRLQATGLGAYIQNSFESGNTKQLILGTIVMCLIVLLINRLVWQPLYNYIMEWFN